MSTKRGAPSSSHSPSKGTRKRPHKEETDSKPESDVFWYPSLATPPPENYTPGMMLLLKRALTYSRSNGKTRRAALCWEHATYACRQSWDKGWGCGYRNFLMACASLVEQQEQPMYFPLIDSPISPSVRQLQVWLELAWGVGYDQQGAAQLRGLVGSSKWIGVSDLWTAFSSRGIPCELVDFDYKNSFGGNEAVMRWIVNHFSPAVAPRAPNATEALMADTIIWTTRMPVILQDGLHSRSVVGFEEVDDNTINLLVFDPSRIPRSRLRRAAISLSNQDPHNEIKDELLQDAVKYFRYHLHRNVFGKQWQILYFPMTEPLSDAQMERRKVVTSTRSQT